MGELGWVKVVLFIILALGVTALCPLIAIWSLNTLFDLAIPFTSDTWTATLCLMILCREFSGGNRSK